MAKAVLFYNMQPQILGTTSKESKIIKVFSTQETKGKNDKM